MEKAPNECFQKYYQVNIRCSTRPRVIFNEHETLDVSYSVYCSCLYINKPHTFTYMCEIGKLVFVCRFLAAEGSLVGVNGSVLAAPTCYGRLCLSMTHVSMTSGSNEGLELLQ